MQNRGVIILTCEIVQLFLKYKNENVFASELVWRRHDNAAWLSLFSCLQSGTGHVITAVGTIAPHHTLLLGMPSPRAGDHDPIPKAPAPPQKRCTRPPPNTRRRTVDVLSLALPHVHALDRGPDESLEAVNASENPLLLLYTVITCSSSQCVCVCLLNPSCSSSVCFWI